MSEKPYPEKFYEASKIPNPQQPFDLVDDYRFYLALTFLLPGSVLDVGAYKCDFLKLARQEGRIVYGTEINQVRVNYANRIMGENVVNIGRLGEPNSIRNIYPDQAVDNVVCMEVIEHTKDHKAAVEELCRVARKRVIITVPYKEKIRKVKCIHCYKYTPYSGHLHSYDFDTIKSLVPKEWLITSQKTIAKKWLIKNINMVKMFKVNQSRYMRYISCIDALLPGDGKWLFVVLTNNRYVRDIN